MGAHGWVAGICQPWGRYSIWGLAGHSVSPWIPQAPTFHLSEAAVNERKTEEEELSIILSGRNARDSKDRLVLKRAVTLTFGIKCNESVTISFGAFISVTFPNKGIRSKPYTREMFINMIHFPSSVAQLAPLIERQILCVHVPFSVCCT